MEQLWYYIGLAVILAAGGADPLAPPKLYIGNIYRSLYIRSKGHLGNFRAKMKGSKHSSWIREHLLDKYR